MPSRRLRELVDERVGWVEGGCCGLRDIGDAPAPELSLLDRGKGGEVDAVEDDGAGLDAASGARVAEGGKADGRLAGTGLADQTQHLAAPKGEVDALDDLVPDLFALALDAQAAYLKEDVTVLGRRSARRFDARDGHSRSPLVLCRNQSTTKLTASVSSAMAPAGSSGVMSP